MMKRWQLLMMVCIAWALSCSLAMADPKAAAEVRKRVTEVQRILKSVSRLTPEKREEVQ